MREKLMALLTAKFLNVQGVRKDGLAQLANSLYLTVTTEDEAKTLVDKLSNEQVVDAIKSYRSSVDSEVSNATKTYEDNLKLKYEFVEKTTQPVTPPTGNDNTAEVIKAVMAEAMKPVFEKLSQFEQKTVMDGRTERLHEILEGCNDDTLKSKIQKDFLRMIFGKEEEFDEYLTDTKTDIETANQRIADAKLTNGTQPVYATTNNKDEVSAKVKDFTDKRKATAGN
jgi:pantothenate synthetase